MRFALTFLAVVGSAASASAQISLLEFNFNGIATSPAPATFGSTFNAVSISTSTISRGAGITANGVAGSFSATGWTDSASPDLSDYFTFTFQSSDYASLASVSIIANRNGLGPRQLELRNSLTGFGVTGVAMPLSNASSIEPISFNTSTVPALQSINAGQQVEFRLYGFAANNATNSQFALDSSGNVPGLTVSGTLSATPVPEPASIIGLSAFGLGALGLVRRRFAKK